MISTEGVCETCSMCYFCRFGSSVRLLCFVRSCVTAYLAWIPTFFVPGKAKCAGRKCPQFRRAGGLVPEENAEPPCLAGTKVVAFTYQSGG